MFPASQRVQMEKQDEKKPPVGGVVVVDQWTAVRYSNGCVMIQRSNSAGRVVEAYRPTSPARAALDLVAVMQGGEPLRNLPRSLEPIGPNGY